MKEFLKELLGDAYTDDIGNKIAERISADYVLKTDAEASTAEQVKRTRFDGQLDTAIAAANGRNTTAIRSLLDVDGLYKAADHNKAIADALKNLKEGSESYLFQTAPAVIPPAVAAGVGSAQMVGGIASNEAMRKAMGLSAKK